MIWLKNWHKKIDPLIIFLAAGLAIYWLIDSAGLARGDERLIVVDQQTLATYLASRSNPPADSSLSGRSAEERQKLINDYIAEEALYREARALGLDRDDTAIRRRLVQSLKFSLQSADPAQPDADTPGDAELHTYLEDHRDRYTRSANVSLSHIFFDKSRRGISEARQAAKQTIETTAISDWLATGDRYPYQRTLIEVNRETLGAEWGDEAAEQIFKLQPEPDQWQGPIESELGFHLVRIDRREPQQEPDFEEIRPQLVAAVQQQQRDRALDLAVRRIVQQYTIEMAPDVTP